MRELGIPTFIQEENPLPGKTNIFNAKVKTVFTAYPNMEIFPRNENIILGNPIRKTSLLISLSDLAKEKLGLEKGN